MTVRKSATLEVLDGKKGGPWDVLISTGQLDRDRDTINQSGWHFDSYRKNPVVMWAHDYHGMTPAGGVPIGKTLDLRLDQQGPIATFNFRKPAHDQDFVLVVQSAWEEEVLRAASVAFNPLQSEENSFGGIDFAAQDLLEWSIVSVPANAGALRRSYEKLLKAAGYEVLVQPVSKNTEPAADPDPEPTPAAAVPDDSRVIHINVNLQQQPAATADTQPPDEDASPEPTDEAPNTEPDEVTPPEASAEDAAELTPEEETVLAEALGALIPVLADVLES